MDIANEPSISDTTLDRLVSDIDQNGWGKLSNFICAEELCRMRAFVAENVTAGVGYKGFVGKQSVQHSAFSELSDPGAFDTLLRQLYQRITGRWTEEATYQVLRCLTGEGGLKHALIFHYDSYIITALIPVEIPTEGGAGDLVMLKRRRRLRKSYARNLIDKVLLDNRVSQAILGLLHKHGLIKLIRVKMKPGDAYFFWGYSTIHANEACDPGKVRATAIYHLGNPHGSSVFRTRVRALLPR